MQVVNIAGRAELLSAALYLCALHVYPAGETDRLHVLRASLSLALAVLAMLAKEQGITALGVCGVLDLAGLLWKPAPAPLPPLSHAPAASTSAGTFFCVVPRGLS
eukprot:SAG11_NODE_3479_length_2423_cov_2.950516_3_plen_105_part_00